MPENDIALMAHLMRRAGFGARRTELKDYVKKAEAGHPFNRAGVCPCETVAYASPGIARACRIPGPQSQIPPLHE